MARSGRCGGLGAAKAYLPNSIILSLKKSRLTIQWLKEVIRKCKIQ